MRNFRGGARAAKFVAVRLAVLIVAAGGLDGAAGADTVHDPAEPVIQLRTDVRALAQNGWPPQQAAVAAAIAQTFDLGRITDAVLGSHAAQASPAQKARLSQALAMRMAREAMRVPVSEADDNFTVVERRPINASEWLVTTRALVPPEAATASVPSDPVVVSWRVAKGALGLRIVDLLQDGVSAVSTQHDDFNAALARMDLDTVISQVESRAVATPTN